MPDIKKPNVGGHPIPTENVHHENTQARNALRSFHRTWGGVIQAIRGSEAIHPTHLDAYTKARNALNIPSNIHPTEVPPEVSAEVRARSAAKHGSSSVTPAPKTTVLNAPETKKPAEPPALDYSKMRPQLGSAGDKPQRTLRYDSRGNVTEEVHEGAPDYKPSPLKSSLKEANSFAKTILAKGPYLKQGSKLGQELYEDVQNIQRKATRTGVGEAQGAGIRAEQMWGGKAGYQTAKQAASAQSKKDLAANKKMPVKTELSAELKAKLEEAANAKKSVEEDKIPGGLADNIPVNEFDPDSVKAGADVEAEHTSSPSVASEIARDHLSEDPKYYDKLKTIEKAKAQLKSYSLKKAWQVAGEVPPMKKEYDSTPEPLSKPPKSEAQRRFMGAVAHGDVEGVPQSVGEKFLQEDQGGKLPEKVSKNWQVAGEVPPLKKELFREKAEDAKRGYKEKRYKEFLAAKEKEKAQSSKKPSLVPTTKPEMEKGLKGALTGVALGAASLLGANQAKADDLSDWKKQTEGMNFSGTYATPKGSGTAHWKDPAAHKKYIDSISQGGNFPDESFVSTGSGNKASTSARFFGPDAPKAMEAFKAKFGGSEKSLHKSSEHPHDDGPEMQLLHLAQMEKAIEEAREAISKMGNIDLPDWLESKIAVAAATMTDLTNWLAFEASEKPDESETPESEDEEESDEESENMQKSENKPFHGYTPERHSREGGLNDKAREKMNRETGSNLKRPVTEDNPGPKAAARRKSFCARMSGVEGPTSKDGKLTPKGAALKRWKCSKSSELNEDESLKKYESLVKAKAACQSLQKRCWKGYEPTPGKEAYSEGSCRPVKKNIEPAD